jgi:putrescine transport system substrate-binding protein
MPARRAGFLIVLTVAMLACGQHRGGSTGSSLARGASDTPNDDAEKILNVYTWTNYIAPDTVANFERETGIKVRYDTFDNNEVLETKMLAGHSSYDIVVPTGPFFQRQIKAGVYRKLDKAALPNLANLDPQILGQMAKYDPGNLYAVPYLWATTGLGYNVDKVHARLGAEVPHSWSLLLDPNNAAKLKDCGVMVVDSPLDVIFSVIIYLGRDPTRLDPLDITAASEVLRRIRPFVRFITTEYITELANGDICLALSWSGDVLIARDRAREATNGVNLAYFVPQEGALISVDMMGIPVDAPHPRNAHVWMNYLMRPDVIADITNYLKFPNGNSASLPLVHDAVKSDPIVYPDPETRARLTTVISVPAEYTRLVNREWTRFRTGY